MRENTVEMDVFVERSVRDVLESWKLPVSPGGTRNQGSENQLGDSLRVLTSL